MSLVRSSIFLLVLFACELVTSGQSTNPAQPQNIPENRRQYLEQREALLVKDQTMSFDSDLVLDSAEQALNSRLSMLRDNMLADYKDQHFFPPARYFFQSKKHIEETDLFKVLRKMPKGGILHLHGAAAGNARWVIDKVVSDPSGYVFWDSDNDEYIKGQLSFYRDQEAPVGFKKASLLSKQVPQFSDSLFTLLTFDESIDGDSVDIWGEFEKVFQRIYGFVRYQPVFKDYFYHAFDQLVADGIQHVELRGIFNELYDLQHPAGYFNPDSSIYYFQEAARQIREKEPAFTLKVIYTALRFQSKEQIEQKLVNAFELRKRYPNFIAGFDLVAEEDHGHSTLFFLDNWLMLDSLHHAYGVDMPLYLHDGESDWVSVKNLYDAALLESKRIGHGFNLFRFPNLMEEIKRKDICLEINPISNQILGFIRDLRLHPGSTYLTRGVPSVISSDDPLIFDYQGLSYDFWEVFLAWELDLKAMKALALNSLNYSALNGSEKAQALQYFNERWNEFVDNTLLELEIRN